MRRFLVLVACLGMFGCESEDADDDEGGAQVVCPGLAPSTPTKCSTSGTCSYARCGYYKDVYECIGGTWVQTAHADCVGDVGPDLGVDTAPDTTPVPDATDATGDASDADTSDAADGATDAAPDGDAGGG